MNQEVANSFELGFLAVPLARQISECDAYELAPLFLELFAGRNVLEAGCGSGRWCGWLDSHGIAADGIDWSRALCDRAQREIPQSRFFARNMEDSGLPEGSYSGLLALGSIEHAVAGPQKALAEFHRLLCPGGVAVITVPYGSPLRRAIRVFTNRMAAAKGLRLLRLMAGKPPLRPDAQTWRQARAAAVTAWYPRFALGPEGWSFYEYEFNSQQMDGFLHSAGFVIRRRFAAFADQGALHTFGRLAGRWNAANAQVDLTLAGRVLTRLLPSAWIGHMLCYVVEKP